MCWHYGIRTYAFALVCGASFVAPCPSRHPAGWQRRRRTSAKPHADATRRPLSWIVRKRSGAAGARTPCSPPCQGGPSKGSTQPHPWPLCPPLVSIYGAALAWECAGYKPGQGGGGYVEWPKVI